MVDFWRLCWSSTGQEIPRLLSSPNIHHLANKGP